MRRILTSVVAATALTALSAGAAAAQSTVTVVTDLNVRAGPGPQYQVIGVLPTNSSVMLEGCLESGSWCRISYSGEAGWVYSNYLVADMSGSNVVVAERRAELNVPVIVDQGPSGAGALAGGTTGAIAGAIAGGPVGAAIGGVAGAATGGIVEGIATPPEEVRRYVVENPAQPVYLEGEVVVGAGLPQTVELREIPGYRYRYVYVNNQPVLIEPQSRRIVYVMR